MKIIFFILFFLINSAFSQEIKLLPPSTGMYHGAFPDMGSTEDIVTNEKILAFDSLTGNPIKWVYFSNNWFQGIKFPKIESELIISLGKTPFIRIMPRGDFTKGAQDPVYTLQKIIDGDFDNELTQYAKDAKDILSPLILEFGTEVNGDWFPWNGKYNGGENKKDYGDKNKYDGPERFRDAYRHIINIFRNEGVNNVTWVYHVNGNSVPVKKWNTMKSYYPGDDYIDWIGVSLYGAQIPGENNKKFKDILNGCYSELCNISADKPLAILEFGVIETPLADKPNWLSGALQTLLKGKYSRIKALSYWNSRWENKNGSISDMRLNSSQESLEIYKKLINDAFFRQELQFVNLK